MTCEAFNPSCRPYRGGTTSRQWSTKHYIRLRWPQACVSMTDASLSRMILLVFCGTSRAWSGRRSWTLPSDAASRTALAVAYKFKYQGFELHGSNQGHPCRCRPQAQPDEVNRRLKELRIPFDPNVVTGLTRSRPQLGRTGARSGRPASLVSGAWGPGCAGCRGTRPPCTSTAWVCPGPLPAC
jgi:hypothetical protein